MLAALDGLFAGINPKSRVSVHLWCPTCVSVLCVPCTRPHVGFGAHTGAGSPIPIRCLKQDEGLPEIRRRGAEGSFCSWVGLFLCELPCIWGTHLRRGWLCHQRSPRFGGPPALRKGGVWPLLTSSSVSSLLALGLCGAGSLLPPHAGTETARARGQSCTCPWRV